MTAKQSAGISSAVGMLPAASLTKPMTGSDNTAANDGHNDEGRTVFGVLAEILNAQRERLLGTEST
ncbi:Uncharacterised protein [Escherichia coli]|uniref:Uncharacterized protein n=1 Tax=Escherichia coli TaxID=562 RepID=A0A376UEW1_ECOLX|nr:Uncharacterised protein [Escherichia coli]